MTKNQRIFIKLQLEKNPDTNHLMLRAHFDNNAPNFTYSTNEISWIPTPEELDFLKESFTMITQMNKE